MNFKSCLLSPLCYWTAVCMGMFVCLGISGRPQARLWAWSWVLLCTRTFVDQIQQFFYVEGYGWLWKERSLGLLSPLPQMTEATLWGEEEEEVAVVVMGQKIPFLKHSSNPSLERLNFTFWVSIVLFVMITSYIRMSSFSSTVITGIVLSHGFHLRLRIPIWLRSPSAYSCSAFSLIWHKYISPPHLDQAFWLLVLRMNKFGLVQRATLCVIHLFVLTSGTCAKLSLCSVNCLFFHVLRDSRRRSV